jgi:hypothetical protein
MEMRCFLNDAAISLSVHACNRNWRPCKKAPIPVLHASVRRDLRLEGGKSSTDGGMMEVPFHSTMNRCHQRSSRRASALRGM